MKVFIIALIVLFVFMLGLLIRILFMRHAQLHPREKKTGTPEHILALEDTQDLSLLAEAVMQEAVKEEPVRRPSLAAERQLSLMWPQLKEQMKTVSTDSGILLSWQKETKTDTPVLIAVREDSMMRAALNAADRIAESGTVPSHPFHLLVTEADADIPDALLDSLVELHRQKIEPDMVIAEGGMIIRHGDHVFACIESGTAASITLQTDSSSVSSAVRDMVRTKIPASLKKQLLGLPLPFFLKTAIRFGNTDRLVSELPEISPYLDPYITVDRQLGKTIVRIVCSTDDVLEKTLYDFNHMCSKEGIRLETLAQNHAAVCRHQKAAETVRSVIMKTARPDAVLVLPALQETVRMKDWCAFTPVYGEDGSPEDRVRFYQELM